jgi:hypothetical protein
MKKLAVIVWVTVGLFGLFGVVVFHDAVLDTQQLTDGYGVSYTTTAVNYTPATRSQTAK